MTEHRETECWPSPHQVAAFLQAHPHFFVQQPQLLEILQIPHAQGEKTVSLVERQLQQFRQQRDRYQVELSTMLDIATENGQLFQKVMDLNASLLRASSEEQAVADLHQGLTEAFGVDQTVLYSFEMPSRSIAGIRQLGMSSQWTQALFALLSPKTPFCGALESQWRQGLFTQGEPVHSVCVLPLGERRIWGVLVLGRYDLGYENDFGHFFLRLIGEMVTAKLHGLFHRSPPAKDEVSID
ncbi:MAG: DUF484 family protein [Thiotrichales bacterium]|nr:DUF484 family protein [Thiotrichales bacterium]